MKWPTFILLNSILLPTNAPLVTWSLEIIAFSVVVSDALPVLLDSHTFDKANLKDEDESVSFHLYIRSLLMLDHQYDLQSQ